MSFSISALNPSCSCPDIELRADWDGICQRIKDEADCIPDDNELLEEEQADWFRRWMGLMDRACAATKIANSSGTTLSFEGDVQGVEKQAEIWQARFRLKVQGATLKSAAPTRESATPVDADVEMTAEAESVLAGKKKSIHEDKQSRVIAHDLLCDLCKRAKKKCVCRGPVGGRCSGCITAKKPCSLLDAMKPEASSSKWSDVIDLGDDDDDDQYTAAEEPTPRVQHVRRGGAVVIDRAAVRAAQELRALEAKAKGSSAKLWEHGERLRILHESLYPAPICDPISISKSTECLKYDKEIGGCMPDLSSSIGFHFSRLDLVRLKYKKGRSAVERIQK
ncbi:uncharacterized protein EDB91DRAFT_1089372 [Suillus paluster]|uniref:uncharacterized protein n=1 Tax=Suillus paluster TaxID=48578 RepID=UPI001B8744FD|nr:uncharacterized protein EDB91DRAFT_1089372 [Suillus paluster]KAG1719383.1 hypothetical protein EDB91DRAFT_1089372 [Suillus paluster]